MIIQKKALCSAEKCAEYLKSGGIAVLPTDTVYGFSGIVTASGNQFNTNQKIIQIKGRAQEKPFIHLIANPKDIYKYTDDKIPDTLLSKWPGALTVIVKIKKNADLVCSMPTVAFRCPGDEWLRHVIELCGVPIYSTSVNRSGKPVLETIPEIEQEFKDEVGLIVDDGEKRGARPSTIVTIDGENIKILRQGDITV